MFNSIPFTPRDVRATESRLQAIYEAAREGLRGDALAFAAGMLPSEFNRLAALDPVVSIAENKGRADGEAEMARVLRRAALNGDAKAALEVLKHKHDWVAKQQVQVDVTQTISINKALADAQTRVIEGLIIDEADYRVNDNRPLINHRNEDGDDFQDINPRQAQRAIDV